MTVVGCASETGGSLTFPKSGRVLDHFQAFGGVRRLGVMTAMIAVPM